MNKRTPFLAAIVVLLLSSLSPVLIVHATDYENYSAATFANYPSYSFAEFSTGPLQSGGYGVTYYDFYGSLFDANNNANEPSNFQVDCLLASDHATLVTYYDDNSVDGAKGQITDHTWYCQFYQANGSRTLTWVDVWIPIAAVATDTPTTTGTVMGGTATATPTPGPAPHYYFKVIEGSQLTNWPLGWGLCGGKACGQPHDPNVFTDVVGEDGAPLYMVAVISLNKTAGGNDQSASLSWASGDLIYLHGSSTGGPGDTGSGTAFFCQTPPGTTEYCLRAADYGKNILGSSDSYYSNDGRNYSNSGLTLTSITYNQRQGGSDGTLSGVVIGVYYGTHDPDPQRHCNGTNVLCDGDMEYYPTSPTWFPNNTDGRYNFGRMTDNDILTFLFAGQARCKHGYQIIGDLYSQVPFWQRPLNADIRQRFTWKGGDLYFRFSIGATGHNEIVRNVPYSVYLQQTGSVDFINLRISQTPNDWQWRDENGMYPAVPAGEYTVYVALGQDHLEFDTLKFDDMSISDQPVTDPCIDVPIPVTTTTPSTITATVNTSTSTPSGINSYILNCGFELGNVDWDWKPGAQVIFAFANNYGHMETTTQTPGISQDFWWGGGVIYVQFDSDSNYNVYLQALLTGLQYPVANGITVLSTWYTHQVNFDLPAGSYKLALHFPAGSGPADYDNVTVGQGGYAPCVGGDRATPTLLPSSTSLNTATMFPSSTPLPTHTPQPSSTTVPGNSTSTPRPTYTPYPTYTPNPTYTPYTPPPPTNTPRPQPTFTSFPTYTQAPTYTPWPTYTQAPTTTTMPGTETSTPRPSYTPGIPGLVIGLPSQPPPPQPPPAYFAECVRPQNGYDVAAWVEYNRCVMLSYVEWSPNAQATMEAWPTTFAGHEPLGAVNEAQDTLAQIMAMLKSYDTSKGGLPGTGDQPDINSWFGYKDSPWYTGQIKIGPGDGAQPNMTCDVQINGILGSLATGFCWFVQILKDKGIMAWIQLVINLAAIGFLLSYIWAKFIDAGSGA